MEFSVALATVLTTCVNQFIVLGFCYTAGVYHIVFLDVFHQGATVTSWVMSVLLGMLCFGGPLASLCIGRFGCGVTMVIGALLSTLGFGAGSVSTSVGQLIGLFGFVAGTGSSLVFTASVVVIPERFTEHRIIAAALSVSGAGIGTVLWPWITRFLMEQYGWRGALLISSGVSLQMCVCGMIISLGDQQKICRKKKKKENMGESGEPLMKTGNECEKVPETNGNIENGFINRDRLAGDADVDWDVENGNTKYPEIKMNIFSKDAENLIDHTKLKLIDKRTNNLHQPLHKSLMDIKMHGSYQNILSQLGQKRTASCYLHPPDSANERANRQILAESFSGQSLSSLPELYRSAVLLAEMPHNDQNGPKTEATRSQLVIITKEVFKDLNFILLSGNILLFCFGFSVLYTHIAAYAESIGLSVTERNTVFSALGISNILGRVLLGLIGNQKALNIIFLYAGCYVLAGVGSLGMALWKSTLGLSMCGVLVGVTTAAYGPVLTEVTCLLLGAHRFYLAYGYLLVFMGIGSVIGAPIAGFAYDQLEFYPASLYIGAAAFLFAGVIILPSYKYKHIKH